MASINSNIAIGTTNVIPISIPIGIVNYNNCYKKQNDIRCWRLKIAELHEQDSKLLEEAISISRCCTRFISNIHCKFSSDDCDRLIQMFNNYNELCDRYQIPIDNKTIRFNFKPFIDILTNIKRSISKQ